jgi:hypothetical protein
MSTLSDIANWVVQDYLNRADLLSVAQSAAIEVYQTICAKIPFDQLMVTSVELPTQQGVTVYDLTQGATQLTPVLRAIASIRMTFSSTNRRRLRRSHVRVYDALSFTQPGFTSTYARWGNSIEMNPPIQDNSWTFRVRYWSRPTLDAIPINTTIITPPEWDALYKWETLYKVLHYLDQQDKAMMLVQPQPLPRQATPKKVVMVEIGIIPRLWNDLLTTVSQQENTDEDFSINPVIRAYSYRR